MLVYNYIIFVYEHKTYQNYKNKTFSRMALSFETRNIFWTPSLYHKQIAEALIKTTTLRLYRQALLQPPALSPLPEEKLRIAYICAESTDSLQATFHAEINITATICQEGPSHVHLLLHFPREP